MLLESFQRVGLSDVLMLDRGYPASWLVAHLVEGGIGFSMRCDKANGWVAMREFLRSHHNEAIVQLRVPRAQDAKDYECSGLAPLVRLVRCISSSGQVRVMAANLPAQDFPASVFGELYHQRWRIEKAFKRLEHRLQLEYVSGLTQQVLLVVWLPRCWRTTWQHWCAWRRRLTTICIPRIGCATGHIRRS